MFGGGIFALAVLALWAYCIFDVIRTDDTSVQNLPKMFWLLIVIFVPTIGSIAWLLLGRPSGASWELSGPQRSRPAPPAPPTGFSEPPRPSPEDHAAKREEALKRYMADREEQLRKREEEVRRLEDELRRREHGDDPSQK
jgi:hypothetical protein